MGEFEPGNQRLVIIEGESGQQYLSTVGSDIEAGESDTVDKTPSDLNNDSSGE